MAQQISPSMRLITMSVRSDAVAGRQLPDVARLRVVRRVAAILVFAHAARRARRTARRAPMSSGPPAIRAAYGWSATATASLQLLHRARQRSPRIFRRVRQGRRRHAIRLRFLHERRPQGTPSRARPRRASAAAVPACRQAIVSTTPPSTRNAAPSLPTRAASTRRRPSRLPPASPGAG